ncbi:MAG: cysteine hydrolase family protein [Nocardioidaceae bacterium]
MPDTSARKTALVVIDVQNSVMADAWQADEVVARIATLIRRAKDEGTPVVYVQHEEDEGMERGSDAWQMVEAIRPGDDDIVVAKRFPDSFAETTLRETLDGLGVGHLVIAGAQTDACIRATTIRTLVEGFDLTLVEDAHTTEDSMFDMTDGEKVPISAKQIVAHTNMCLWNVSYPGVTSTITPHHEVEFVA